MIRRRCSFKKYVWKVVSGKSPLIINNSERDRFRSFSIIGNTVQNQDPPPSPSSPQEIKNVGKWNEEKQKYEVNVKVTGKNLINASVFEQGYLLSVDSGQKVSINTGLGKSFTSNMNVEAIQGATISISVQTKEKAGKKYVFTDEADTIIRGVWDTGNNSYSIFENIQIPQNACKLYFSVTYDVQENTQLQVELGNNVTSYEPYREPQATTLLLNEPLRAIKDYKDILTSDICSRIVKKVILIGNEPWQGISEGEKVFRYRLDIDDAIKKSEILSVCDSFVNNNHMNSDEEVCRLYNGWLHVNILKSRLENKTFKEWLSENNIEVQYVLSEPVIEPLSDEFKQSLNSLKTYYPTTVIAVDGGEVIPSVEVQYAIKELI